MLRKLMIALSRANGVRAAMVAFPPTRAVVSRFVAGETVDECLAACRRLTASGLYATVDRLGEDTTTWGQARATADAYVDLLGRLAAEGLAGRVEVSVKLSAVGQSLGDGGAAVAENAARICAAAAAAGTTVTLDAEDHTTTDATLATLADLRVPHPWVGAVLQAYLLRTPADARALSGPLSRVRLCKGAYDEPATVALRDKAAVDAAYVRCLDILFEGEGRPMIASHDPAMIDAALAAAARTKRDPDSYEFQMLYGIRTDEQARLAAAGHTVRVYVPFGTDWYGYFTRRLAERPSNLLFFLRALVGR